MKNIWGEPVVELRVETEADRNAYPFYLFGAIFGVLVVNNGIRFVDLVTRGRMDYSVTIAFLLPLLVGAELYLIWISDLPKLLHILGQDMQRLSSSISTSVENFTLFAKTITSIITVYSTLFFRPIAIIQLFVMIASIVRYCAVLALATFSATSDTLIIAASLAAILTVAITFLSGPVLCVAYVIGMRR